MQGSEIADRYGARPTLNGRQRTPFRIGCRVLVAGAVAGAMIVAFVLIAIAPLDAGQRRARQIVRVDLLLQQECAQLRDTLTGWQRFLEPELDAIREPGATPVPADIAKGSHLAQAEIDQAKALGRALRKYGLTGHAQALDAAMSSFTASVAKLTPVAAGEDVTTSEFTEIVGTERIAFTRVWDVTSSIQEHTRQSISTDVQHVTHKFDLARTIMVIFGTLALSLSLGAAGVFARRATRRERTRREVAQRNAYGSELQQALELSKTDSAVYGVVRRALREAVPELSVEMLIADSSRAHFSRVLASSPDPEHADGCGVVSPNDCPATTRGQTMVFASSDAISACPYLQDRASGSCSAICIPVSMAGHTVGVMHATGANNRLPVAGELDSLELSARRAAERLSLLRTFQRSETQARTDPLTGLLNRRSLETQVRDLHSDGIPYALAYGDLDHFKALNDTHGHETGDQALRLFARVMRDSVRPSDLVARYGGEEFVIVLPDCGTNAATAVLERVREQLALSLASGRVPAFTVSFGLATSAEATTFDEIVDVADHALLNAKAAGRNRVVLAASA